MLLDPFLTGIASNLTTWLTQNQIEPKHIKEQLDKAFHEAFTANADVILPLTQDQDFTNNFFSLAKGEVIDTQALIQKALDIPSSPLTRVEILQSLHRFCINLLNIITKTAPELGKVPAGLNYFKNDLTINIHQLQSQADDHQKPPQPHYLIPFHRNYLLRHHEKWIEKIRNVLWEQGQVMVGQSANLHGGGGLGKTAMAVEYAYRYQKDYPGGVYWLQMDQGLTQAARSFSYTAQYKIPELKMPEKTDEKQIVDRVITFLHQSPFKLVVLDNMVQEAIPGELSGLNGHILVTSRRRDLALSPVEIKLPSEDEALDIFLAYAEKEPKDLPPDHLDLAGNMCERVGYLPLALEIMGKIALTKPWPALAQRLEAEAVQLETRVAAKNELTSVLSALRLAEQEFRRPQAKDILIAAGYLHPEDINPAIICGIFQIEFREAEDALTDLANFSLLEPDSTKNTYLIHRLTQKAARFEDKEEEIGQKAAAYLDEKVSSCTESGRYLEGYHLLPHLFFLSDFGNDREVGVFPNTIMVSWWAGYVGNCGGYSGAENIFRACLIRIEKEYGKENENFATVLNNLALMLSAQGQYGEAEDLYRKTLVIGRKTIGAGHPDYAIRLSNLAGVLSAQGQYGEAEALYREALEIDRKTIGPNHPEYAKHLNNLAGVLGDQGQYGEAEALYREALEIDRKTIGAGHPDYAIRLSNLAVVMSAQGQYGEAEALYREALEIGRKTIGPGHPNYAIRLSNLAVVLKAQGQYGEAEALYREALEIDRKTIGPDHPGYAIDLNNLALVLSEQGQYGEAEALYREALEIARKTIGPDHPDFAKHLNNLAELLRAQGQYGEAEKFYCEALDISQRRLGPDHPQTRTIQENLAILKRDQA